MATSVAAEHDQSYGETPITPREAAQRLGVAYRTVFEIVGLEWVEYETKGSSKPIRRITPESVRRLLAKRKGR